MDFSKISIGIRTFLRDDHLFQCVESIEDNMPGAQMIIVDDGNMSDKKGDLYCRLTNAGHVIETLPFDMGFGFKSNCIADIMTGWKDRPYLLMASDDFNFTADAARGVDSLLEVLENCPDVHIASGRVGNRPYEFYLDESDGVVREVPVNNQFHSGGPWPWTVDCDLTVNYSLMRRDVLKKIKWDNDVKIGGGEHAAFFLDCKHSGLKTVWVPGVSINELQIRNTGQYNSFRARANRSERPCFVKRGIRKYILGDGRVDYDQTQQPVGEAASPRTIS